MHCLAALSVRFVAMVTIGRAQSKHADAWHNEVSQAQFQDPWGRIKRKKKEKKKPLFCAWPLARSLLWLGDWRNGSVQAGASVRAWCPAYHYGRNLLRPGSLCQKAILQIICLSSERLEAHRQVSTWGQSQCRQVPRTGQRKVQIPESSLFRKRERGREREKKLSPLYASWTVLSSSLRVCSKSKQLKYRLHVFF